MIKAFKENKVSYECLNGTTGYGYNDIGRDTLENVYADVFGGESALVRSQITCGTHALNIALSSVLRPGDELLSPVGKPYDTLEEVIGRLDVLYMTRIQEERFASKEEYLAQKNTYVLDRRKMQLAGHDMIVMHPLPRVDEITDEVDNDPRAMYFKQAKYGVYVRMALILTLIRENRPFTLLRGKTYTGVSCGNPRCITNHEHYLPKSFRYSGDETLLECEYCDERKLI